MFSTVGRVYNAEQMPPYELPANKTQTGIKTRSSSGGSGDNFNEIRFEDKKGSELLYVHAEKNQDNVVENDETTSVGHDRTETVGNDETITIGNDRTESVGNNNRRKRLTCGVVRRSGRTRISGSCRLNCRTLRAKLLPRGASSANPSSSRTVSISATLPTPAGTFQVVAVQLEETEPGHLQPAPKPFDREPPASAIGQPYNGLLRIGNDGAKS